MSIAWAAPTAAERGRIWKQRQPIQTTGRRAAIATLLLGGGRATATGAMEWQRAQGVPFCRLLVG